jgi:hypothetical protein
MLNVDYNYGSTTVTGRTSPLMVSVPYGATQCFAVRGRDRVGNVGTWSARRCLTRPWDDRSFAARGFTRKTSSAEWLGTSSRSTLTGATLSRSSVTARQVVLLVTTCTACGSVDVLHAGRRVATLSLRSSSPRHQVWIRTPLFSKATGTLTLKTRSTAPVVIDGIAAIQ